MALWETYRPELISFVIVASVVTTTLGVFHYTGFTLIGLANVLFAVIFLSFGLLRVLAVAEGIFLLEVVAVSTVTPLFFEWSVRFELVGVAIASAFIIGFVCNRLTTAESRGAV